MKKLMALIIFLLFFSLFAEEPESYIYDVRIDKADTALRSVFSGLDVWSFYKDDQGRHHYVIASNEAGIKRFSAFKVTVLKIKSVQTAMTEYLAQSAAYRNYEDAVAALSTIASLHPELAKVYIIGQTLEKRDIPAIKISAAPDQNAADKTEVLITGLHHAREWIGLEVSLRLAEFLVSAYEKNERVKGIVDSSEIWIMPIVNPDGYNYSWTKTRNWRKNRLPNGDGTYGVDLNRNYNINFCGEGAGQKTKDDDYCGKSAFSEPESTAVKNLAGDGITPPMNNWADGFKGFLDYHSYQQAILYPFGQSLDAAPTEALMKIVTQKMADIIKGQTGVSYLPMKSSDIYVASGVSNDWFYVTHNNETSLAIELRPAGNSSYGFSLPASQIEDTARENIAAALYFIEYLMYNDTEINTDKNSNNIIDYFEDCSSGECIDFMAPDNTPGSDADTYANDADTQNNTDGNTLSDSEKTGDDQIASDEQVTNADGELTTDGSDEFTASDTDDKSVISDNDAKKSSKSSGCGCSILD